MSLNYGGYLYVKLPPNACMVSIIPDQTTAGKRSLEPAVTPLSAFMLE